MDKVSKEMLREMYKIRGKPMREIATELGIAVGTYSISFKRKVG